MKRWVVGAFAAVVFLAVVAAAWGALHHVSLRERPRVLWTERDLPPLPPPEENGWELVRERPASFQDGELVRALERAKEESDWEAARTLKSRLEKEAEGQWFRATVGAFDAAAARPRFVYACPLDYATDCQGIFLIGYQRVIDAAIFGSALRGDWEAALERLEAHLRSRLDLAASSRGLLVASIAVVQIDSSLKSLRLVLEGLSHEKAAVPAARMRSIARLLETPAGDGAVRRAVISEYLYTVSAIRLVAPGWKPLGGAPSSAEAASFAGRNWVANAVMDPDHTLGLANAYFVALMSAVDGTSREPLPEYAFRTSPLWWLYNPTGKMLLESGGVPSSSLDRITDRLPEILDLRSSLKNELLERAASLAAAPE